MITIPQYIRITQTREQTEEYTVYNSQTGEEYVINQTFYNILFEINKAVPNTLRECIKIIESYDFSNSKEIYDILFSEGLIKIGEQDESNNVLNKKTMKYPLTTLTIELTNLCSLNCIHCYGMFGKTKEKMEYTLKDIKKLKEDLDYLHVQSIVLTGGDIFLNKNTIDIAQYFLANGFKITLLTNGWEYITFFCSKLKKYQFTMAFSLDGLETTHDFIRGRKGSFNHVLKAMEVASANGIKFQINTTVMKANIMEISRLQKYIEEIYPSIHLNLGLMIPVEEGKQAFGSQELDYIYRNCPSVLQKFDKGKKREERCLGGITLCSLGADRKVTICTAAKEDDFLMGDIYVRKLSDIWMNPPENIKKMRDEKHLDKIECKQCKDRKKCETIQDCRVYAKKYAENADSPNPICCYVASKKIMA